MTVRINTKRGILVPLDNIIPSRGMEGILFSDVDDLEPPIPERIALLRIAPVGEVVTGVGVRLDEDTFIVQEC